MSLREWEGGGHVGINAHLLSGQATYRRAGIHHYIEQVLSHLPAETAGLDSALRYTVYTGAQVTAMGARLPGRLVTTRWPTERPMVRILWEQLVWPLAAVRYGVDLLHSMAFVTPLVKVRPTVVTVYDLSFIHYPERFPPLQRLYLRSQTWRSCGQARRVVAIAEAGRQELHRLMGIPLARIDVVRPGVDAAFCPRRAAEVAAFRQREGLPDGFVLHVGTLQPRKNIPILLEAVARLKRPGLLLVLVGGKGWYYDEIFARVEALGLQSQVRFTGYVDDADLPLWMQAASVLVFPSVYEGFGMPVAQAMAVGTPVIAADTSAIPEVAGEAALLFDPQDVEALAGHLAAVLDEPARAALMRERGLAQAARFSWAESGREMAAVYRRALREG